MESELRTPAEIAQDELSADHVDGYEVDLVQAGLRETHELLLDVASAIDDGLKEVPGRHFAIRVKMRDTLARVEAALARIEE